MTNDLKDIVKINREIDEVFKNIKGTKTAKAVSRIIPVYKLS